MTIEEYIIRKILSAQSKNPDKLCTGELVFKESGSEKGRLMSGIDWFRWKIPEEMEIDLVLFHCNHCPMFYEVEVQDLEEIAVDGMVPCECGELIRVDEILRSKRNG